MAQSSYPSGDDLATYIRSLGCLNPVTIEDAFALMNLDIKAEAASNSWEDRTGYHPFLATVQTMRYDPCGRNLRLEGGLISLTSLTVGVTPSSAGRVMSAEEYVLYPYNARTRGKPYREIHFTSSQTGPERSVVVVGSVGYNDTLTDNYWETILHEGARLAFGELSTQISRGLYSYSDMNTEIRYVGSGLTPMENVLKFWEADFCKKTNAIRGL